MAHFGEPRPSFLSKLYDNVINMRNGQLRMGLLFIEDFIFLVKKIFWTKFKKLVSERNFDLEQKNIFFLENNRLRFYYSLASSSNILFPRNFYLQSYSIYMQSNYMQVLRKIAKSCHPKIFQLYAGFSIKFIL